MKNVLIKNSLSFILSFFSISLFCQNYNSVKRDTVNYFSLKLDLNKDGKQDEVFSNKRYVGDNLLFYINHKNVLNTKNLSEDGGFVIKNIISYNKGDYIMKINTYFPYRGDFGAIHYIAYKKNNWVLSKTLYYINYWDDKINKAVECKCWVNQNVNMKNLDSSLIKYIPDEKDRKKNCSFKYKKY